MGRTMCVFQRKTSINIFCFKQRERKFVEMNRFHLIISINSTCPPFSALFNYFFVHLETVKMERRGDSEGTKRRCPQGGSNEPKMIPKERAHMNEPDYELKHEANEQSREACTSAP